MTRLRRLFAPWRDVNFAFLAALVLLAGVAQARAMTEMAGKAHFADGFALCLQGAAGEDNPPTEHDCDQCRLPGAASLPALPPGMAAMAMPRAVSAPLPAGPGLVAPHPRSRPEARGPPAAI